MNISFECTRSMLWDFLTGFFKKLLFFNWDNASNSVIKNLSNAYACFSLSTCSVEAWLSKFLSIYDLMHIFLLVRPVWLWSFLFQDLVRKNNFSSIKSDSWQWLCFPRWILTSFHSYFDHTKIYYYRLIFVFPFDLGANYSKLNFSFKS